MEVSGDGEANVSVTDEQAFSDAVSDRGRWRSSGRSSGSPGADGPGSASRSIPEAGVIGGGLRRLPRVQGLLLSGSDVRMLLVDRFL